MCCQSLHSTDLKILIFENVQVLLTGDTPRGSISVPPGKNLNSEMTWASWSLRATSLAAVWRCVEMCWRWSGGVWSVWSCVEVVELCGKCGGWSEAVWRMGWRYVEVCGAVWGVLGCVEVCGAVRRCVEDGVEGGAYRSEQTWSLWYFLRRELLALQQVDDWIGEVSGGNNWESLCTTLCLLPFSLLCFLFPTPVL